MLFAFQYALVPVAVIAADEELSLDNPDVKACVEARFTDRGRREVTPDILERGSFRLLIRECVDQRRGELAKNERTWRLQRRAQNLLSRLGRNSKASITHFGDVVTDPQKAIEKRNAVVQEAYRMRRSVDADKVEIPVRQPVIRFGDASRVKAVQAPTEHPKAGWRTYTGERPSRRTFEQDPGEDKLLRQQASDSFQQRQKDAFLACDHHTSSYSRENCIRLKIRELGKE